MNAAPLIARCITLAGSLPAGVLLYRIAFWHRCKMVERAGHKWIVNSMGTWQNDTGLTTEQLRDGFAGLRRAGLIHSERHLFKSKIHSYARFSDFGLQAVIGSGQEAVIGSGQEARNNNKGVLEGSSGMELNSEPSFATPAATETKKVSGEEEEVKSVGTVKDLEKVHKAQMLLHKPDKASGYGFAWKEALSEATGQFVPNLTKEEIGKLVNLSKKCPSGKTVDVIRFAVKNWSFFAGKAKVDAGLYTIPTAPSIGFLLTHADAAISLAFPVKPQKKHEAPKAVDKTMQLTASPEPNPVIEPKLTIEQILADPDEDDQ